MSVPIISNVWWLIIGKIQFLNDAQYKTPHQNQQGHAIICGLGTWWPIGYDTTWFRISRSNLVGFKIIWMYIQAQGFSREEQVPRMAAGCQQAGWQVDNRPAIERNSTS